MKTCAVIRRIYRFIAFSIINQIDAGSLTALRTNLTYEYIVVKRIEQDFRFTVHPNFQIEQVCQFDTHQFDAVFGLECIEYNQ